MARLADGLEEVGHTGLYTIQTPGSGTITVSSTIKAGDGVGGAYSLRLTNGARAGFSLPSAETEIFFRVRFYGDVFGSGEAKILMWRSGATELGSLRVDGAARHVAAYTSTGTLVATGTASLLEDAWYIVTGRIKIADSTNGVIEALVDGVSDINFTGDTKPGSDTTIDQIHHSVGAGMTMHYDDVAINDTDNSDGLNDNTYPGNHYYALLRTNAAGDNTALTLVGAATNWEAVNAASDSSYVESATSTAYDLYNFTTKSLATDQTIVALQPKALGWGDGDGVGADKAALVLKPSGGSVDAGPNQALGSSAALIKGERYKLNPHTTAAWTQSDLNAVQAGPKVL